MSDESFAFWFGGFLGLVVGAFLTYVFTSGAMEREAAATPCAQFSPATGEFEWLPKNTEGETP